MFVQVVGICNKRENHGKWKGGKKSPHFAMKMVKKRGYELGKA
jgi:hypothetical protein